jgi:HEAT repeat protein
MPREQLQALAEDVNRLLTAGGASGGDDAGLRRRAQALRGLAAQVPALRGIADAADRVLRAGPAKGTAALCDLLVTVRRARAGLASADSRGQADPVPPSGPWATPMASLAVQALVDGLARTGPDSTAEVRAAIEGGLPADLRLLTPLEAAFESRSVELADLAVTKALPAFGPAVVPELRRRLDLMGNRPDARRLAAVCLIDDKAGRALCREALTAGSPVLQEQALASLLALDPAEAEKAALGVLAGKPTKPVRGAALAALGGGRSDAALDALLEALAGPDDLWTHAVGALATLPHPGAPGRLLRELGEVRAALDALPPPGGKEVKGKKRPPQPSADEARQLQAAVQRGGRLAEALLARGEPEGVGAAVALLAHHDAGVRGLASRGLRHIGPGAAAAVPQLVAGLKDVHSGMRGDLVYALMRIGPGARDAVPALVDLLTKDKEVTVRERAAATLGVIGPGSEAATAGLTRALRDKEQRVRWYAARALGKMGPAAVPALIEALCGKDDLLRAYAADSLGDVGVEEKAVVAALSAALGDRAQNVRWTAARSLGRLGPAARDALPGLKKLLDDPNDGVARAAQAAIEAIEGGR